MTFFGLAPYSLRIEIQLQLVVVAMQGLRPVQAHQDENSGFISRGPMPGKAFGNEENRPTTLKDATNGLASARKALGNITNNQAGFPGLQQQPSVRKAMGPALRPSTSTLPTPGITTTTTTAKQQDRIDRLAQDGVEKLAGKGWDELERDREMREDEEISQRLLALVHRHRHVPTYFPHWVRSFRIYLHLVYLKHTFTITFFIIHTNTQGTVSSSSTDSHRMPLEKEHPTALSSPIKQVKKSSTIGTTNDKGMSLQIFEDDEFSLPDVDEDF